MKTARSNCGKPYAACLSSAKLARVIERGSYTVRSSHGKACLEITQIADCGHLVMSLNIELWYTKEQVKTVSLIYSQGTCSHALRLK